MKFRLSTVSYIAVIAFLLSACYPVSNQPLPKNKTGSAQPSGTPIPKSTNSSNHQGIDPTKGSLETNETVKVNNSGLTAEIKSVDLNPDWPTVTLCADVPSLADWMPRFSAMYRGKKIPVMGWRLLDPTNSASKMKNRCFAANLSTDIFAAGPPSGTLLFSLDYWETSTPENAPKQTPNIVNGPWAFAIELPAPAILTSAPPLSTETTFLSTPTSVTIISAPVNQQPGPLYDVVFQIPLGSDGVQYRGVGIPDSEITGPDALAVLPDGTFIIADLIGNRLLRYDQLDEC